MSEKREGDLKMKVQRKGPEGVKGAAGVKGPAGVKGEARAAFFLSRW